MYVAASAKCPAPPPNIVYPHTKASQQQGTGTIPVPWVPRPKSQSHHKPQLHHTAGAWRQAGSLQPCSAPVEDSLTSTAPLPRAIELTHHKHACLTT